MKTTIAFHHNHEPSFIVFTIFIHYRSLQFDLQTVFRIQIGKFLGGYYRTARKERKWELLLERIVVNIITIFQDIRIT
jgi:hypothetical protein